jgi:tetratricopeptide (TPR) repeat protein
MRARRTQFISRLTCVALLLFTVAVARAAQQPAPPPATELETFAQELINAPAQKRSDLLSTRADLMSARLRRELVRHGNLLLIDGKYAPAFEIYQLAEKVAERIDDKEGIATTALNIGSVYYFQGNYERALENYRRAQELFTSLANRSEAARSLFGIALTFQAQKKLTEALNTFEQAANEYEALNDNDELANTLSAVGSIQNEQGNYDAAAKTFVRVAGLHENADSLLRIAEAFYRQNDYAQAHVYYERSLDYASKQKNAAQEIAALNGAANCYYYQRNYDQALAFYQRSLIISDSLNDKSGVATQLQNIGNIYRALGDYASALQNYFKSLSAAEVATTKATIANTLGSIGLVRSLQGDNTEALDYFDKSLHTFETSGDLVGMARMLSYIGNAQYIRREYELALAAYERSLALYRSRSDHVNEAHILLGIGAVYANQQKSAPAAESYQQALRFYEEAGRKPDAADALLRLAALQRLQHGFSTALEFANNALRLARESDSPAFAVAALTEIGRLQRSLNRPAEALAAFADAIKIQRSMNAEPAPDNAETEKDSALPYLGAMEVFIEQDNALEAFKRADEAKSQRLRELMNRGNFRVTKGMNLSEQQDEKRLLGEFASVRLQLNRAQASADKQAAQTKALRDRLNTTRAAYEAFRKRLYAKHPQMPVNRGELAPVNLADLRPLLRRDAAILEYAVTEDNAFLFVVTNEAAVSVKAYQLSVKPAELAQRTAGSSELYDLLIKPAEQQLAGKTTVIVVPDGVVWDVPFAALRMKISYAISVAALREMHKRNVMRPRGRSRTANILVLSNPVLTDDVRQRLTTAFRGFTVPESSKPSTPDLDQFRSIYGKSRTDLVTGAAATKERVEKETSTHAFLHFATPVLMDHAAPLYSFVLLSTDPNHADDGLLRLREVTSLNSNAKVVAFPTVVFTNSGSPTAAAFIATSWAWFVAGTPTVILTRSGLQMTLGDSIANR